MAKKRGLNRGLDALLADTLGLSGTAKGGTEKKTKSAPPKRSSATKAKVTPRTSKKSVAATSPSVASHTYNATSTFLTTDVGTLRPSRFQPRKEIQDSDLESLANSIKAQGILQPIVVRELPSGGYEIVAGERRWRAAQKAGLEEVPVIVKSVPDEAAMAIALIENMQRENLNPLEEAQALLRLTKEFDLTQEQVARAVGKSRAQVSNLLRLLSLAKDVKLMLERGDLDVGHAKVLLALGSEAQVQAAKMVVAKDLSVRETELLIQRMQGKTEQKPAHRVGVDPDVMRLQNKLADMLGAKVQIQHLPKGKGKVVIHYNTLDELDGILSHIDE